MKSETRIIIIEDNIAYRDVIHLAIEDNPKFELVDAFAVAETALRSIENLPPDEQPEVALLDLNLPGMSGLEAIPWFKKYCPDIRIIVLSQSDSEVDVIEALDLGADGYLLKSATLDQISSGIEMVVEGGVPLDAHITKYVLKHFSPPQTDVTSSSHVLSEREREVLALLAEGLVKKEIAQQLSIGLSTVVTHVSHIYEKLEVPNAPAAINKAHQLGLFSGD